MSKKWNKSNQKIWLILVYYDVRKYFDKLSPSEIQRNWSILCLELVKKRLWVVLCGCVCLVVGSVEWIIPTWSFLSDLCNIVLSTLQWLPAQPGGNHTGGSRSENRKVWFTLSYSNLRVPERVLQERKRELVSLWSREESELEISVHFLSDKYNWVLLSTGNIIEVTRFSHQKSPLLRSVVQHQTTDGALKASFCKGRLKK